LVDFGGVSSRRKNDKNVPKTRFHGFTGSKIVSRFGESTSFRLLTPGGRVTISNSCAVPGKTGRGARSAGRLPRSPDPRSPQPSSGGRAGAEGFGLAAVDSCAGSALVLTAQRVCWALAGAGWDENCCCCYLWQLRSSKLGLAAVLVYSCLSRRVCASFDCI
jgi:hypothetical protein